MRGKPLPGADIVALEAGRRLLLEQIVLEELSAEEQQRKATLNQDSISAQQQINKLLEDAKTKEEKRKPLLLKSTTPTLIKLEPQTQTVRFYHLSLSPRLSWPLKKSLKKLQKRSPTTQPKYT